MFNKKVFISYSREDQEVAKRLYDDLRSFGVDLWLDKKDLLPGQDWEAEIRKAITKSTYFLALLSSKSINKRGFTQKELKYALDVAEQLPMSDIFIIPVRIDNCKPISGTLQDLHWIDLFPSYENGLRKIMRVIKPDISIEPDVPWERK